MKTLRKNNLIYFVVNKLICRHLAAYSLTNSSIQTLEIEQNEQKNFHERKKSDSGKFYE